MERDSKGGRTAAKESEERAARGGSRERSTAPASADGRRAVVQYVQGKWRILEAEWLDLQAF